MTIPTLPTQGSTSWYPWAEGVDDAARTALELPALRRETGAQPALARLFAGLASRLTQPVRLVFVGSSTTEGVGASETANRYVNRLMAAVQAAYPAPGGNEPAVATSLAAPLSTTPAVHGYNRGVGGTSSATYLADTLRNAIIAANPAMVLHMVGSNDYAAGVNPATYKANLASQITQLRAGITMPCVQVLVHPYGRLDVTNPAYPWDAYGDAMRELAEENPADVAFLDLSDDYEQVAVPGSDPLDLVGSDGIHQTDRGHAFMADLLRRRLGIVGAPNPAPAPSASTVTRTLARWTSDNVTGAADATSIVGRTTDTVLGGTAKTWAGDANSLAISNGAIVRATGGAGAFFAGVAEPIADVELSFVLAALPTSTGGADLLVDIHRTAPTGVGGPDTIRLVITSTGSVTLQRRVSGASLTLGSFSCTAGDRLALRYHRGALTVRANGAMAVTVTNSDLPNAGYSGFSGAAPTTGFRITGVTLDVVT